MWGSDISRINGQIGFRRYEMVADSYPGRHTYAEALHFIRDTDKLSQREKECILGASLRSIVGFPASAADRLDRTKPST
jgi:hypothetical protein